MKTVFAFGVDSLLCLNQEIADSLDRIIELGYKVIVGDDKGASALIQGYLADRQYKKVTVYHTTLYPKCFYFSSLCRIDAGIQERNKIMIERSDYGLAVWDGVDVTIGSLIQSARTKTKVIKCRYRKPCNRNQTVYIHSDSAIGYINKELFDSLNRIIIQGFDVVICNNCELNFLIQEYLKFCLYPKVRVYSNRETYHNGLYTVEANPGEGDIHDYLLGISDYRLYVWPEGSTTAKPEKDRKDIFYLKNMDTKFSIFTQPEFYLMTDIRGIGSPMLD